MSERPPQQSIKGRGAAGSPQGRFEIYTREREPQFDEVDEQRGAPRTVITAQLMVG